MHELQEYRKKGETRSLCIQLGRKDKSATLKQQILTNPAPPKLDKPKDLMLLAIIVPQPLINTPIKSMQAIDTTRPEVTDNIMTIKDNKLTLDEDISPTFNVNLPTFTFDEKPSNLLRSEFLIKSKCLVSDE